MTSVQVATTERTAPPRTVYEVIQHWAALTPRAPAMLHADRPPVTFQALIHVVERFGTQLNGCGLGRDDRIAIVHPGGTDMAMALVGVAAHATAVPLNPNYTAGELAIYLKDFRITAVAVAQELESPARDVARHLELPLLEIAGSSDALPQLVVPKGSEGRTTRHAGPAQANDVAGIFATSGTTSHVKIVPLLQHQMIGRADLNGAFLQLTPDDRVLNLMPLFHGAGLLSGILALLRAGASTCSLASLDAESFYRHLAAVRPTFVMGAPTVFHSLLAQAHRFEPALEAARPNLRMIRTGAGKLDHALAERLEETFQAPVVQVFGSSETGWMACDPLEPAARKAGSVGKTRPGEIAVMDEDGRIKEPGETGEIVARGDVVFLGYENDPAATAAAFTDGWCRTGDLGHIDADGFLFLTGRLKEMINRGGQKITPTEVDEKLLAHPEVDQAATFPVPHPTLGEDVAAAVVLKPKATLREEALSRFLLERLAAFKVPRRLLFVEDIPKGPTGKVQRHILAAAFGLADAPARRDAADSAEDRQPTPLEKTLQALWARSLGLQTIGLRENFFQAGGDSLKAVELFLEIEKRLGRRLPRAILFEAGTVSEMARYISDADEPSPCLVPIQPEGNLPPFFCVHDQDGHVLNFRDLGKLMAPDQPFYGIQARGLEGEEPPFTKADDMVGHYVQEIRRIQPTGPYFLGGYSFGGRIAYLMAQQLRAAREDVALLALFDTYYRGGRKRVSAGEWLSAHRARLADLPTAEIPAYGAARLRSLMETLNVSLRARMFTVALRICQRAKRPLPRFLRRPAPANDMITRATELTPYDGDAVLFKAERPVSLDPEVHDGWRRLIKGRLELRPIPGRHADIMNEPHVRTLAAELSDCIRERL